MDKNIYCPECGRSIGPSKFLREFKKSKRRYVLFCTDCLKSKWLEQREITGDDLLSLYIVLAEIGYPAYKNLFDILQIKAKEFKGKKNSFNYPKEYLALLRDSGIDAYGFFQSDLDLSDFLGRAVQDDSLDKSEALLNAELEEKKWGRYTVEEYKILNHFYDNYTFSLEEEQLTWPVQCRYRDLCKAELMKRKAEEDNDVAALKAAQDIIKRSYDFLKLDKIENVKSDMDRFLDRLIWQIEETEPCEEEDEAKYRDIAGFEMAFKEIMRSMRNLIVGTREYPDIPKEEI